VTRNRIVVGLLMVVLAVAAVRDLSRLGVALPWHTMDDFADFYCAGAVLDAGASPYTYEPLHSCEHRANVGNTFRARLFAGNPSVAAPAPQPAFDFLPFMALAKLPFWQARIVGAVAILVAVALCVVALAALGVPWPISAAALALSTAFTELNTGQIVPYALLALVTCGLCVARNRYTLAGFLAALTAIEPTAGLPVILATLLFVPRARVALVAGIALLAACAVVLIGPSGAIAYLTTVLPAHAGSELHFPYQYSATYIAAWFGAGPAAAALVGAISYLALLVVGLLLAPRASAQLQRRELLVFVPAFCAVVGGAFLHQEELCFALPALLVYAWVARGKLQIAAAIALCALSIPWILVWGEKQLFLASLFVCAVILLQLRLDARVTLVTLAAFAVLIYLFELQPPHLPVPATALRSYPPNSLVQNAWRDYTEGRSTKDPLWFAIKMPTWLALLAGLAALVLSSFSQAKSRTPRRTPAASRG
jgi:hypothetical protein